MMQITEEGYLLTRDVFKVRKKENKILKFIYSHKVMITITLLCLSLIIVEGVLLNEFIKLLSIL